MAHAHAAAARQFRQRAGRRHRGPYEYSVPGAGTDFTPQNEPTGKAIVAPRSGRGLSPLTRTLDIHGNSLHDHARPDTGLYNAKLGIWLFLASEVMLFGGLFSAYIFLRVGARRATGRTACSTFRSARSTPRSSSRRPSRWCWPGPR